MQVLKSKTNGVHGSKNDHWLTPRYIIKALGPFDLDPCCEEKMPWRTAKKMWHEGGLDKKWSGRVWLNPPYSRVLPWAERFVNNGVGIALVSMKSADTKWFHLILEASHSMLIVRGRISFCYPSGQASEGSFLSSVFFSLTASDTYSLAHLNNEYNTGKLVCL